jgi:beta-lactam-binding protein with PASTA domain
VKVTGKSINKARSTLFSKGCKVKVIYKKSTKKKGTVLSINRKVGKKLVYHALVKVIVAAK